MDPSGEKVPAGKKSMACSLTYRASDRTLTQEEANAAHGRLKSQLVDRLAVAVEQHALGGDVVVFDFVVARRSSGDCVAQQAKSQRGQQMT